MKQARHPTTAQLLDYWLHDSDADATDRVEAHLMQCDACGQALDELVALGRSVGAALRAGTVATATSAAYVRHLVGLGLKVREYRLAPNDSVNCTVAPADELLVSHLVAPLQGVRRLDAVAELSIEPGVQHRLEDIPFDARDGEVHWLPKLAEVRRLPAHTLTLTLQAVDPGGPRDLGRYTFCHQPWPGSEPDRQQGAP